MVHARGCPLPLPSSICGVGGLASSIVSTFFSVLQGWYAAAAGWLLTMVGAILEHSTAPPVASGWFLAKQRTVLVAAAPVALLALIAATLRAAVTGSAAELGRLVAVRLPAAILLGAAGAALVAVALQATDDLCALLTAGDATSLSTSLHQLAGAVMASGGLPGAVGVLSSGLVIMGALALWVELVVRSAAIVTATALLPLVFAAALWPPGAVWARRLVETLVALIVSKAGIVLVLSLALSSLTGGQGVTDVVTGASLLFLAAAMPYVLLRLVPVFEGAAAAHLESVRQRGSAAIEKRTRQAVTMGLDFGGAALAPSEDLVGSDPIPWADGTVSDEEFLRGTVLDPDARFVIGRSPFESIPASRGRHVWERDEYGPQLVWYPDPEER